MPKELEQEVSRCVAWWKYYEKRVGPDFLDVLIEFDIKFWEKWEAVHG